MKKLLSLVGLFSLLLLGLGPVRAGVDTAVVPADAKWLLQVDFVALRESPVGRELIAMAEKNADIPIPSANIKIDMKKLLATIESATAYGTVFSKNPDEVDGTLLIRGTDELHKIAEAIVIQASISQPDTVTELKGLPIPAYVIKGKVTVAFPPEPIVLVSRSQTQLLKTYDLFRGKGPAAPASTPLKAMAPKAVPLVIFAASEVPNTADLFAGDQPQARILKMASAASVAISNDNKHTAAVVQLLAANDEYADKLLKIVQGMVAMLSLAQSDDKQLAEFMQSVKADRSDRTIVVSFSYPNEGLIQLIHNLAQQEPKPAAQAENHNQNISAKGRVVDTWKAGKGEADADEAADAYKTRTIADVALKNGTILVLAGERDDEGGARLDYVEIVPSAGGQPLHFEAENMKLWHYKVEKSKAASGGRDIILGQHRTGTARFEFPGVEGSYTIKVHYGNEEDGEATFTLSLQEPENPAADTAPAAPPVPPAPLAPAAPAAPGAN